MLAATFEEHAQDTQQSDAIVVLRGVSWSDYQRLLEVRGEKASPRFSYLEGELEIMTPSRFHESLKSRIGRLVEVWCLEQGLEFSPYGSWTLESKPKQAGLEPDECYVFGVEPEPARPDLAIEVIWTSGNLRKLEIYRRLGVPEVWVWRRGQLGVHLLEAGAYRAAAASRALPGTDLSELASFLDRPSASQGIREYRALLVARAARAT